MHIFNHRLEFVRSSSHGTLASFIHRSPHMYTPWRNEEMWVYFLLIETGRSGNRTMVLSNVNRALDRLFTTVQKFIVQLK